MAKAKESTKIKGVVEVVNEKGIKIDGEWYNFSKYNRVETPSEGDEVEIEVREKWIKSLWKPNFTGQQREGKSPSVDSGTRVTRLALLNTATSILSTHGKPVEVESVINTAHVLETYVYEDRQSEDN